MEVKLSPDLEGRVARAADRRSVSADVLIREAIEQAVDYDDWFNREVEKGLAQIDGGHVLTHDAVDVAEPWTPRQEGGHARTRDVAIAVHRGLQRAR